ncbi:MAG: PCRF domain-containing protein [Patescibacteria group bacterium]|nr:PCRF domain-containing protein [Patescibacteria group bacterium]
MQTNPYQNQIKQIETKIKDNQQLLVDPELEKLAQEEIIKLKKQKKSLQKAANDYKQSLKEQEETEKNPTKKSAAILEIRAGAGGDEAKIWANDLLRMYCRYSTDKGLKVEIIDNLVVKISGKTTLSTPIFETEACENQIDSTEKQLYPYQLFQTEAGVHRVQRVPTTETQGRIHTSTASVAVLPEIQAKDVQIKKEDLEWEFMRSSGAGGQSVNKTNSAVRLRHIPTNIAVRVSQERKQLQNREIALELLRSQLWQKQKAEREKKLGKARAVIGGNKRAEKIRTYNYPQNRITDHRIHHSWHQLENILEGDLDGMIGLVSTISNKQKSKD